LQTIFEDIKAGSPNYMWLQHIFIYLFSVARTSSLELQETISVVRCVVVPIKLRNRIADVTSA